MSFLRTVSFRLCEMKTNYINFKGLILLKGNDDKSF